MIYKGELEKIKLIEKKQDEILAQMKALRKDIEDGMVDEETSDGMRTVMRKVCEDMPFPDSDFCEGLLRRHFGPGWNHMFPDVNRDQLLILVQMIFMDGTGFMGDRIRDFIGEWRE